ncbi:MAG: hypothetical protein K2G53_03510 [Muribaculaceae bacterium]|nr:hypothetical protein [Muribaculaceae bacterium]
MMKIAKYIPVGLALFAVCMLASCKGRTMSNMEPTGDTVEVEIPVEPDTI